MTKIIRTTTLLGISTALLLSSTLTPLASAATVPATNPSSAGQALEIAPPVLSLTADPGQVIKTTLKLRNVSNDRLVVRGQVNDFVANGEDGTPKLILDDGETNPYSMKSWIQALPALNMKSKELQDLPVTIHVPAGSAPGGYFAVIRF